MNPFQLFSPSYLLDAQPGYEYSLNWPLLVFFLLVFGLSFKTAEYLKQRPHAKLEAKFLGAIPSYMRWFAFLGLIFNFFRDQNIPYISMRLWLFLLFLSIPVYAAWTWKRFELKFEENKKKNKKVEDKYLPKPKKKKKTKKRK